jgi:prepilin-type processing-associated H-X9-DG protein
MASSKIINDDGAARSDASPPPLQFGLRTIFVVTAIAALLSAGDSYGGWSGFFLASVCLTLVFRLWANWTRRRNLSHVLGILFYGSCVALIASLLPDVGSHPSGRLAACTNNLKQVGMALQMYETDHGCFPPVYTTDAAMKPLHSWRTLLLPYLEQEALLKKVRLNEPWNSLNNRSVTQIQEMLFQCPSDAALGPYDTSYVAVIAPGSIWSVPGGAKRSDIKDDPHDTVLFVEMHNSGIPWAEPRDLDLSNLPPGITKQNLLQSLSNHAGGFNAVFADGHEEFIREDIPWADFEAMLTIAGGEKVDRDKW